MKVCLHKLPSGNRLYQAYFGLVQWTSCGKTPPRSLSPRKRSPAMHARSRCTVNPVVDSAEGELGRWIEAP
ncbi:MAG: hypothetical protein R3F31_13575 [Verrucomicrobiales bacterium]